MHDRHESSDAHQKILEKGVNVDRYLACGPKKNERVFGLNIACVFPFPDNVKSAYLAFAEQLKSLGPSVFVYSFAQTHVTIATLASFKEEPLSEDETQLVVEKMGAIFSPGAFRPFTLHFQRPVLDRTAAILPIRDQGGVDPPREIVDIRKHCRSITENDSQLRQLLIERGRFNIPGIVHSTILRFQDSPADLQRLLTDFDSISEATIIGDALVSEILVTAEVKPYMQDAFGSVAASNRNRITVSSYVDTGVYETDVILQSVAKRRISCVYE